MNIRSKVAGLLAAITAFFAVAVPAYAEDLLGNSTTAAFDNLKDTQNGMTGKVLAVVCVTVAVGLAIKWVRKAG